MKRGTRISRDIDIREATFAKDLAAANCPQCISMVGYQDNILDYIIMRAAMDSSSYIGVLHDRRRHMKKMVVDSSRCVSIVEVELQYLNLRYLITTQ